jgi:hypothetical protein
MSDRLNRILWNLAPLCLFGFMVVEMFLGGGAFYLMETGEHVNHKWYDMVPALGVGGLGPLCAALLMFKANTDFTIQPPLLRKMRQTFWFYMFNYVTMVSVYVISHSAAPRRSIEETLTLYFPDNWQLITFALVWSFIAANFLMPGMMLSAMGHDQRVSKEVQDKVDAEQARLDAARKAKEIGTDQAQIIEAIKDSEDGTINGGRMQSQQISYATGIDVHAVRRICNQMVDDGLLDSEGLKPKWFSLPVERV